MWERGEKMQINKEWLEKAIPLNIGLTLYEDYAKYIVNIIYDHIFDKESDKKRSGLIRIIANLRLSYDLEIPLRYSRNTHNYKNSVKNYGVGSTIILKCMDKLLLKDLINQSSFFFNRGDNNRWNRQTRVWASKNLIGIFEPIKPEHIIKEPPQLIQLRERLSKKDKKKGVIAKQIHYPVTKDILLLERQLVNYHNLLKKNHICLEIPAGTELDKKSLKWINEFPNSSHNYSIWINNKKSISRSTSTSTSRNISTNTQKGPLLTSFYITMCYCWIHRVFTETFKLGGRFYGGAWQSLTKELRKFIKINTQPTVELDYSGFHIRMLYHIENINNVEDVYACGQAPRELYKIATLVLVNSKSDRHYQAVRKAFVDKELHYDFPGRLLKKNIMPIINDIFNTHEKINKYFFSDKGIELQNKDSIIISNVLNKLMDNNVIGLPVHDSVIVQKQHEDILKQFMTEEYEKVMKFKPIID